MQSIDKIVRTIETGVEKYGVTELSKRAGVPLRTLQQMRKVGYEVKTIKALRALENAAK